MTPEERAEEVVDKWVDGLCDVHDVRELVANAIRQAIADETEARASPTESAPGVEGRGHNRYVPKDGQTHAEPPAATVPESIHEAADIILEVADYINDACNDSTGILGSKSVDPLMRAHALLGDAAPQSGKADYESWSKQNAHAEDVRTRIPGAAPPAVVRAPDDVIKRVQRRIQYVMAANAKHLPDAKVHLFVSDVEHLLACAASGKKEDGSNA